VAEQSWPLDGGYRIDVFSEQRVVDAEDVIEIWTREGGLTTEEAQRRIDEMMLVAVGPRGDLAGISTAYLEFNHRLQAELWYVRAFVAAAHRKSSVAVSLAVIGRQHLVERYVSGLDRRGIGILYEVENDGLKRHFPLALWLPTDFTFIGENAKGDHVRVHYFPGAPAPEPGQSGSG
jgi:hypothetical protein